MLKINWTPVERTIPTPSEPHGGVFRSRLVLAASVATVDLARYCVSTTTHGWEADDGRVLESVDHWAEVPPPTRDD